MLFDFPQATPQDSGFKPHVFPRLIKQINSGNFGKLDSLLVLRNGYLVFEGYFNGYKADHLHPIQSVSKSIQSILVGICLDQGLIKNLDEPIIQFFEEYQYLDWSGGKDKITIRHLLCMTTGIQWNESEMPYQSFENQANQLVLSSDWLAYALSQPMEAKPGTIFNYSSANPILFAGIIKKVSGLSNETFALKYLFQPLDINKLAIHRSVFSPEIIGDYELVPKDLLKIGWLMLQKGKWNGNQLVSGNWVAQTLSNQFEIKPGMQEYGFFWWRKKCTLGNKEIWYIYAWGYGGQHIFLFPELDLVFTTTASYYNINQAFEPFEILEEYILLGLT
ncbi:serine hydrolase domain-containing protein [Flexithrix dorotheae]|uniref:serine hydrolase domain-containing protein n=1 Tax=Flexithrix dorotheae TaxID=70993 RepID=UPI00037E1147|nr:serine hydrolase [Flexithrix dorotheae]